MAVGSGVQWSSPVAWRSEPIRLPCGGGTGLSGGSPQLSSAAAVMTSAARVRRATFIAVLSWMEERRPASRPLPPHHATAEVEGPSDEGPWRVSFGLAQEGERQTVPPAGSLSCGIGHYLNTQTGARTVGPRAARAS